MRAWSVTARGLAAVRVRGRNWIVALGRGLEEMGRAEGLSRLACEVLPNGTVIARDVASGVGYVVQAVDLEDADELTGETAEVPKVPNPLWDELTAEDLSEDQAGEPLYELPQDELSALDPAEDVGFPILRAETALQACQIALTAARELLKAESGAVILEERGYLRFVAVHGPSAPKLMGVRMPAGTGVAGFAMERRRSVVLADAHADPRHWGDVDALTGYVTREMAVVPLVDDERSLGVLEVMNLPEGRRFEEADLKLLHQVADALTLRLLR